jgi:hypothetical protein
MVCRCMPVFPSPSLMMEQLTISQAAVLSLVLLAFIAVTTILDRK